MGFTIRGGRQVGFLNSIMHDAPIQCPDRDSCHEKGVWKRAGEMEIKFSTLIYRQDTYRK